MSFSLRSTVALCGASLLSSAPSVLAQSSTWVGPFMGSWNAAANWSNGVPGLGGPNQAVIPGGFDLWFVSLDASPVLASLAIGPNVILTQPNNVDVTIGNLSNAGQWIVQSTGTSTDILLNGDAVFSGTGGISLEGSSANRILGAGGTRQLTLANGSIAGAGQLGVNTIVLVNESLVAASGAAGLVLDLAPSATSVNRGTLRAQNGSTLTILSSEIDNADGVIASNTGGTVLFRSSMIHGGEIYVSAGASAKATFEATTFDGVTFHGAFTQPDNADVAVMGTVVNDAIWSLESAGAGTEIRVASDVVTLSGSGVILMSDSLSNKIITPVVGRTLVNSLMHTIAGAGQVGAGGLVLHNEGIIEANRPAGMVIDCTATPVSTNSGELRAADGAELLIVGSELDNTDGLIIAHSDGVVRLRSSTITGGAIAGWEGEVRTSVYPPTLVDLEVHGPFRQVDGEDVLVKGWIEHHGEWSLQGDATLSEIFLAGDLLLHGPGVLTMNGPTYNNRIHSTGGPFTLSNFTGHTIRGGGELGLNDTILNNSGKIVADAHLVIDTAETVPSLNTGLLAASEAGTLELSRTSIVNQGTITADSSSLVIIKGSTITGGLLNGTMDTLDDGLVVVEDTNTFSRLDSITFEADGVVQNGAELRIRSRLTNDGSIVVLSTGADTNIALEPHADGTVTFDGDGVFELSDNANNRISSTAGVMTLINGADHTIAGAGSIGNGLIAIDNHGTIASTHAHPLHVKTPSATIGFANHGYVRAANTGEFRVEGGAFTNDGTIESAWNASLVRIGSLMQSGGMTKVDGGLTVTGTYTQTGGLLTGDGTLHGDAWIEGGSASASNSDGGAVGSLAIQGDYGQALDGGLIADLGVDGHDSLSVTGTALLGGALQIRLVDPFVPMPGQEFTILTATNITGTFGCIEYPLGGAYFHVVYLPQSVKLVVDSIPVIEADLDFDGVVGAPDLAILLGAWGDEPCGNAICCPADLNGDGKVNAPDLALLLGDWG